MAFILTVFMLEASERRSCLPSLAERGDRHSVLPELPTQLALGGLGVVFCGLEGTLIKLELFNVLVRMLLTFLPSPLLDIQETLAFFPKVGSF